MKKTSTVNLIHFIYIPIGMYISYGEDIGTKGIIFTLSIILSLIIYTYNLGVISLSKKIFKHSNISYFSPAILLVVFYFPTQYLLNSLDLFRDNGFFLIFTFTLMSNSICYVLHNKSH